MQSIQPGVNRTSLPTPPTTGPTQSSPTGPVDRVDLQKGVDRETHARLDRMAAREKTNHRVSNVGVGLSILGALSFAGSVLALMIAPPLAAGLLVTAGIGVGIGVPLVNIMDYKAPGSSPDNYL